MGEILDSAGKTLKNVKPEGITLDLGNFIDYEKEQVDFEKSLRDVPFNFVTPKMLTEAGDPEWVNPVTKQVKHARISHMKWMERNSKGLYRPHMVERGKVLDYMDHATTRFMEAKKGTRGALRESFETGDYNGAVDGRGGTEYLPMPPGPYSRQLYLWDFWRAVAKAFEAYNHNPIAHGGVQLKTAFTIGQGIRITAEDPEVQDFFDWWLMEEGFNSRLADLYDMLQQNGEWDWETWKKSPGHMGILNLDPATIWDFITNPRNTSQRFGVWMQYQTQWQLKTEHFGGGGSEKVSEYVIELLPPDQVKTLTINCHENEKRGRSDLYSILGWLKWAKDFYYAKIVRAQAEASFSWDHLVKGNGGDVRRVASKYTSMPRFGSVFFHNENEARTLMAFDGAATRGSEVGNELLNLICLGFGIPKEYMGLGDKGSRAQAVVATDPFGKQIIRRRGTIEVFLRKSLGPVLQEAINGGKIKNRKANLGYEISWDELSPDSTADKVNNLINLHRENVISHKRLAQMASQEVNITDYDYEKEQETLSVERQNDLLNMPGLGGGLVPPDLVPPGQVQPGAGGKDTGLDKGARKDIKDQDGNL